MNVGILTFHASHNCGSMLQAFALQYVLEHKFNVNCEIINFSNKGSRDLYGMFDSRLSMAGIRHNINNVLHYRKIKQVRNDYILFSSKYLKKTKEHYSTCRSLRGIDERYDIIISGGDQVWNIMCQDADDAYFLNFANNVKKIAYSPSFGAMNIMKYAKNPDIYKRYLLDYDYLSIREFNGQKWLKDLINIDVPLMPDPTMLLTKAEWDNIFNIPNMHKDFIFNYAFNYGNEENNEKLKEISLATKLPVYIMDANSFTMNNLGKKYGFVLYPESGPLAFLKLMKSAKLVITQSFHGTLFSCLFNKVFWPYRNKKITNSSDDRAASLTTQLGIYDRYKTLGEINIDEIFTPIDYNIVNKKITELSDKGYTFLNNVLNN